MNYRDVVNTAIKEIGYQGSPKKSKYSAELDAVKFYNGPKNGAASWCKIFYDWCVYVNIKDVKKARAIVCEPDIDNCGAGCKQAIQYYKDHGRWITVHSKATTGDEIFFKKGHTGIIVDWNNKGFYVVEGNTDGNKVNKHFYYYGDSGIEGFGRPDWYKYESTSNKESHEDLIKRLAKDCIEGKYGNGLTRKQRINGLGYGAIYTEVQNCVNLMLRGIV